MFKKKKRRRKQKIRSTSQELRSSFLELLGSQGDWFPREIDSIYRGSRRTGRLKSLFNPLIRSRLCTISLLKKKLMRSRFRRMSWQRVWKSSSQESLITWSSFCSKTRLSWITSFIRYRPIQIHFCHWFQICLSFWTFRRKGCCGDTWSKSILKSKIETMINSMK